MTGTVIALIVIGLVFIFASFFVSEAVSDSLQEEGQGSQPEIELTEEQKEKLKAQVESEVQDICEDHVYRVNEQLSTLSNEKTMALGDYAVSVYEEIEKNHKEVMFLYSMLGDKEKELKMLVEQVDALKEELNQVISASKDTMAELRSADEPDLSADPFEETFQAIDSMDVDFKKLEQESVQSEPDNANEIILELKKSGMSMIEIAKQLGLGVGEVKLVVDLYESSK